MQYIKNMKKVILSTTLNFNSHEELVRACIESIEHSDLSEESGVPEDWENEDTWTDDVICEFLKYQGSMFYEKFADFEDIFNDDVNEVSVEIRS